MNIILVFIYKIFGNLEVGAYISKEFSIKKTLLFRIWYQNYF